MGLIGGLGTPTNSVLQQQLSELVSELIIIFSIEFYLVGQFLSLFNVFLSTSYGQWIV